MRCIDGRDTLVHRRIVEVAGEDRFGTPWDPTLIVMHLCDNPPCFLFDHLRLGTRAENQADMKAKGRGAGVRGERHVKNILTESQVLEIFSSTETQSMLAERFGVHKATIGSIKSGRNWSWLTINHQLPRRHHESGTQ